MNRDRESNFPRKLLAKIDNWIDRRKNRYTKFTLKLLRSYLPIFLLLTIAFSIIVLLMRITGSLYYEILHFLREEEYASWNVTVSILFIAFVLSFLKNTETQSIYGFIEACIATVWIHLTLVMIPGKAANDSDILVFSEIIKQIGLSEQIEAESIPVDKLLQLIGGFLLLRKGFDNMIKGATKIPSLISGFF